MLRATSYLEEAKKFLEQAKEELRKGEVRQAAEKLWGSAALAIKAHAMAKEGRRLSSHGELWEYKRRLEDKFGEWVHDSWNAATSMHVCFYEGWCNEEDVKNAMELIERLVKAVEEDLENGETKG